MKHKNFIRRLTLSAVLGILFTACIIILVPKISIINSLYAVLLWPVSLLYLLTGSGVDSSFSHQAVSSGSSIRLVLGMISTWFFYSAVFYSTLENDTSGDTDNHLDSRIEIIQKADVPVKRYIILFFILCILLSIINGAFLKYPGRSSVAASLLLNILCAGITAFVFAVKYRRPFNPSEYKKVLVGSIIAYALWQSIIRFPLTVAALHKKSFLEIFSAFIGLTTFDVGQTAAFMSFVYSSKVMRIFAKVMNRNVSVGTVYSHLTDNSLVSVKRYVWIFMGVYIAVLFFIVQIKKLFELTFNVNAAAIVAGAIVAAAMFTWEHKRVFTRIEYIKALAGSILLYSLWHLSFNLAPFISLSGNMALGVAFRKIFGGMFQDVAYATLLLLIFYSPVLMHIYTEISLRRESG